MKILMVSEDVPHRSMGGLAQHALTLARALADVGHEVDFMGNNIVPYDEVKEHIKFSGRFFPDLNMKSIGWKETQMGIYNPIRRPFIAWRFARSIMRRAADYDVIHYHGHFPLLANHISKDINFIQTRHDQGSDCLTNIRFKKHDVCRELSPFSCASCATVCPNTMQSLVSGISVWIYRKLTARAFRQHKTIFVSNVLQQNFCRTAGKHYWGEVIHNFVDCSVLRKHASVTRHSSDNIEVFIASKLYEPKGIDEFLKQIHTKVPQNMRIVIAGDGSNEPTLRNSYCSDRIVLLGWQDYASTIRLMNAADIVLMPSIVEESCSTTVLEALALGTATFALNRGGTPELKRYEQYYGQLSLFDSMEAMVNALLLARPREFNASNQRIEFAADVAIALGAIVRCYSSAHTT